MQALWVLGAILGSSGRAAGALKHKELALAPYLVLHCFSSFMCVHMFVRHLPLASLFSPFTLGVLGTELRLSGLEASTSTC